ncbi:hypothetical protein [Pararhizobium sp. IMCC21322]|uniref:hypothetical protein n=1 Tax=Pararhizobium sp. IMCC21322 TaxID=3067903 RepID=UPI002740FDBE|nr:hypothetical protein [Pararhizobium sp. IMCC21322]
MKYTTLLTSALILVWSASASYADQFTGSVVAFDRKANVIVLDDKSVFLFEGQEAQIPDDLKAGDKIEIEGEGEGEDGYGNLTSIKIVE